MEKILNFFDDCKTAFFALESNGDTIAKNSGEQAIEDVEEARAMLQKGLSYIPDNAKVAIKCYPNKKNYSGQLILNTYNNESGTAPGKNTAFTSGSMAGSFSNSSSFEAFMLGMKMGREEGMLTAKLDQMNTMIQEMQNQGGGGGGMLESLASTEQGQMFLGAIAKKLGLFD